MAGRGKAGGSEKEEGLEGGGGRGVEGGGAGASSIIIHQANDASFITIALTLHFSSLHTCWLCICVTFHTSRFTSLGPLSPSHLPHTFTCYPASLIPSHPLLSAHLSLHISRSRISLLQKLNLSLSSSSPLPCLIFPPTSTTHTSSSAFSSYCISLPSPTT